MGRDRGIDLPVEHLLDASCNGIATALVRVVDPKRPTHGRGIEVDDRPLQVGGAARLDEQAKVGCLDHDVGGWRILGRDQVELVDELAASAAGDRDPQARVRVARL